MTTGASGSYTIISIKREGNLISADVLLNDVHDLFKGHFPGNPIVPGVLNIEIIQSIVSEALGNYKVERINQLKFLKPVVPGENNELHYSIDVTDKDDGSISLNVTGFSASSIHVKAQIHIAPEK